MQTMMTRAALAAAFMTAISPAFAEIVIDGSFEPPSYAVVLIDEASVIVHTHDFLDGSGKFDLRHSPVADWALKHAHP